jgi:glycogen operon protein
MGPTLSMRGIDNAAYYRLVDDDPRYYMDYTGTGNSLNVRNPHTLQLIMDSLRYWVTEMHVDGFRFDLASTLAREFYDVDRLSVFFDLVQQDPVISQAKLIAEPWDVGPGGYQVGNFPPLWTEWNGKYRDTVRDFWRGEPGTLGEFTSRLTGSSDLYQADGRRPFASINFVTAHDGFTLNDLVSYNEKHNDANGEGGNDGESHNRSWNCGVEGPTDDAAVLELRARQQRNFITTLFLSQGVPMLLHGDEMGRTQSGNNNVYAQDSAISWMDWSLLTKNVGPRRLHRRGRGTAAGHPVFRRRRFFAGKPIGRSRGTDGRTGPAGHRVVHPVGRGDDRAGLGLRLRQVRHGVPQRQRHHRGRQPRRAGHGRLVPACASTRTTKTSRSPSRRRSTARGGRSSSTRRSARCSP